MIGRGWRARGWPARVVLLVVLAHGWVGLASAEPIVVRVERAHTVSGVVISDAALVIEEGKISWIGAQSDLAAPAGALELAAHAATPGLIDADTSAGLAGILNVSSDRDQDEPTDPDQAELRVIDAFNPREPLLRYLLEHGVTIVQATPGPANPIAGQAAILRTHGTSVDAMLLRSPSALVFNLGDVTKQTYGAKGRFPSTRMGTAALIRRRLAEGRAFVEAEEAGWLDRLAASPPPGDRRGLDVLGRTARGELTALVRAHRADDITTVLRLVAEEGLRAVLAGGTEAYLVRDPLRAAGISVLLGPVMERVSIPERENASYETPALLAEAGIPFAIRSGFESYVPRARVVLFEAAIAAANGLGPDAALRAITLGAAELLGIEEEHGSLEVDKVADLVLFDGDPLEYTTHVVAVVANGELVHRRAP